MTDPYNSAGAYRAAPPPLPATNVPRPAPDPIASLAVSETWKKRFRLIEQAGGPTLPRIRELDGRERMSINFNGWAFLFGVFYLLAKGLWRQGVAYLVLVVALSAVLVALHWEGLLRPLGMGFAAVFALRANVSYYRRIVLGDAPWL